jgi:hypothetical protein
MSNNIIVDPWLARKFKSLKGDIDSKKSPVEGSIDVDFATSPFLSSTIHGSTGSHMLEKHT